MCVGRTSDVPVGQVAADFGIAELCLCRWIHKAEQAEGPNVPTVSEPTECRALKRRIQGLFAFEGVVAG